MSDTTEFWDEQLALKEHDNKNKRLAELEAENAQKSEQIAALRAVCLQIHNSAAKGSEVETLIMTADYKAMLNVLFPPQQEEK